MNEADVGEGTAEDNENSSCNKDKTPNQGAMNRPFPAEHKRSNSRMGTPAGLSSAEEEEECCRSVSDSRAAFFAAEEIKERRKREGRERDVRQKEAKA